MGIINNFKEGIKGAGEFLTASGAYQDKSQKTSFKSDFLAGIDVVKDAFNKPTQAQDQATIQNYSKLDPNSQLGQALNKKDNTVNTETLGTATTPMIIPTPEVAPAPVLTPPPPPTEPIAPTQPTTPAPNPYEALNEYMNNVAPPTSTAEAYLQAQQSAEMQAKQQRVNQVSAQLSNIQAQGRQAQLELESRSAGKDVTTRFLGRQQQEIARQTAIQSLPLQMEIDLAQGDLASAESNLNTLFQLKSDDAKNMNDFRNNLAQMVYGVATGEQQRVIDAQIREENRAYETQQANQNNARNVANSIMANQPQLSAKMAQIDWSNPNAQQEFAQLQAQVSQDPMDVLDRKVKEAQLRKLQVETSMIGQPTSAQIEKAKTAEEAQIAMIGEARTQVDTINGLIGHKGMTGTVGAYGISRWTPFTADKADKQDFIAGVEQLIDQKTLDTLIELKKAGGTLGALSDQERIMLKNAASKIGNWAIADKNGKVTGYAISEKYFKAELETIKALAQKAISEATGSLLDDEEDGSIDELFKYGEDSSYFSK